MKKPRAMFDRDREWAALVDFVTDAHSGAMLGVVSGRRRQGKSFLLEAITQAAGGFYFGATEATNAESLRRIGDALTDHVRPAHPYRFEDWHEVADALLGLGREQPVPVVVDEFPDLARAHPALPSILQDALGPLRTSRTRSRTRLLLCGSALSFMGRLLAGGAPLRGRAGLELVVRTFGYRLAAEFWGIDDPRLAVQVNAIVGGTPAYRREFTRGDAPQGPDDFDAWVVRTVLSPESPLFREARYLLAEEPDLRDTALYNSVLSAIAQGHTSRGAIAGFVGRPATDIAHPIDVLEDVGLVQRDRDVFRHNRSNYRIAEPLITFYHAVMRPVWDQLEHPGGGGRVWRASRRRFAANVLGPHFEQLCREWMLQHADPEWLGGLPAQVGRGGVNDPAQRVQHDVDVVAVGMAEDEGPAPLLAIGEAKWNDTVGLGHLDRLHRILELVTRAGRYDTSATKLLLFSGAGFNDRLQDRARQSDQIRLVDVADLYRGS